MNWLDKLSIPLRRLILPTPSPATTPPSTPSPSTPPSPATTPPSMPTPTRRAFMVGGLALVCAPAIVRFSSIMPVRSFIVPVVPDYSGILAVPGQHLLSLDEATREAMYRARDLNWHLLLKGEHPTQLAFDRLAAERWKRSKPSWAA